MLAPPLSYIYDRHAPALNSPRPAKPEFAAFMTWARTDYANVFYLGGGGTDPSRHHRWRNRCRASASRFPIRGADRRLPKGLQRRSSTMASIASYWRPGRSRTDNPADRVSWTICRWRHFTPKNGATTVYRSAGAEAGRPLFCRLGRRRARSHDLDEQRWPAGNGGTTGCHGLARRSGIGNVTPVDALQPTHSRCLERLTRPCHQAGTCRLPIEVPTWNPHTTIGVGDTRDLA